MEDLQKIRAKSVVKNKFWILQKNNIKVGHATMIDKDIIVMIKGEEAGKYASVRDMKESGLFEFTELPKPAATISEDAHGYPTDTLAYNAVWNVKYKLPLYTQTADSKSWFAAGYYKVDIFGTQIVQYCPKLITLQRNKYEGPFKTDPGINQFNEMFK
jgi:hypothetical protein